MKHSRVGSAAHPPWMVPKEKRKEKGNGGRGGNNRRSGRKPDQGNAWRGGNRRSTREIAVDEIR